jgi:TonB family protein
LKILTLLFFLLLSASLISQEASPSRADNIKIFNESQRCFKAAIKKGQQLTESRRCAKLSLEAGRSLFEPDSKNIAILTYNYGKTLDKYGKERRTVLENATDLYEYIHGKDSPELISLLIDAEKANRAVRIAKDSYGGGSILYADTLLAAGMSDPFKGARFLEEALQMYMKAGGPDSLGVTLANFYLGKNKMAQAQYKLSIPYFLKATKNPSIASYAHAFLVDAYDRTNQQDKATKQVLIMAAIRGNTAQSYIPLFVQQPKYPDRARRFGKEGYAMIELTVSKEGLALNPTVIEEKPEGQEFGKAALKAAASLRYVPRFIDGEPVEVPGVLYKYNFNMAR